MKKSDSTGQCHIPEEILVEILCRLPRKSRCRFKCVSKQWCNLISNRSLVVPKTTEVGLVFQCVRYYVAHTSSATFLRLDNRGGASVDYSSRFNVRGYNMNKKYVIFNSHDGFLLLRNCSFSDAKPRYLVYNPITKFLEPVAPPDQIYDMSWPGLVFDGNHLKLIFFVRSYHHSSFTFHVYSLEDKKWKKRELERPSCHFPLHSSSSTSKSLLFKGAMHWPLANHLLIYHLQKEFLKLIELPSAINPRDIGEQYIFEFEGQLQYCKFSGVRIEIWVLQMEEKNYAPSQQQCFKWDHMHSGVLSPLNSVTECLWYSPFAFNEDFGILYIRCNENVIISYNIETKKQDLAYECPRTGEIEKNFKHVGFPFLYTSN